MEFNQDFFIRNVNTIDFFRIAQKLKIEYLPVNLVIDGITLLLEDVDFRLFNDIDSVVEYLINKIDFLEDDEEEKERRKIKRLKVLKRGERKLKDEEFPKVNYRTEQKKRIDVRVEREILRSKELTPEEREEETKLHMIKNENRKRENELRTERFKINALSIVSTDSEDKKYSILVLCANNSSFVNQKWSKILRAVDKTTKIIDHNLEEYKVYYVGKDLTEVLPFRIEGEISNILHELGKFDIIINEHCSYQVFTNKTQRLIVEHMKDTGLFVTPDYTRFNFNEECFTQNGGDFDYLVLKKNEI